MAVVVCAMVGVVVGVWRSKGGEIRLGTYILHAEIRRGMVIQPRN